MQPTDSEGQLEFFELSQTTPGGYGRKHRLGRIAFELRSDQLIMAAIATVLGFTVVFACGVERGKQLVRTERILWSPTGLARDIQGDASCGATSRPPNCLSKPTGPMPSAVGPMAGRSPTGLARGTDNSASPTVFGHGAMAGLTRQQPSDEASETCSPAQPFKTQLPVQKNDHPSPLTIPSKAPTTFQTEIPNKTININDQKRRYAVQVVTYTKPQMATRELNRLKTQGEPAFLMTRNGHSVLYVGPFPSKANAHQKQVELRTRYQDCFVKTL